MCHTNTEVTVQYYEEDEADNRAIEEEGDGRSGKRWQTAVMFFSVVYKYESHTQCVMRRVCVSVCEDVGALVVLLMLMGLYVCDVGDHTIPCMCERVMLVGLCVSDVGDHTMCE